MGIVDSLFLLHIGCFGCTLVMAIILVFSRLQTKWINERYERARWLLFVSMIILAVYFLFQLKYSFYSVSELVGGTFSILICACSHCHFLFDVQFAMFSRHIIEIP